jgi:aspartate-semialdehyde dehydrogenase
MVGHSEAVNIEFHEPLDEDEARDILREAPGLIVIDKRDEKGYITPKEAQGEFPVFISRIRNDPTVENGLSLWVVADNLRKGAALNAVQIAQLLHERGLLRQKSIA